MPFKHMGVKHKGNQFFPLHPIHIPSQSKGHQAAFHCVESALDWSKHLHQCFKPNSKYLSNDNLLTGPLTQAFLALCVCSLYTQADYSLRYSAKNQAPVVLLEWLLSYFGSAKHRLPTWIQGWKSSLF